MKNDESEALKDRTKDMKDENEALQKVIKDKLGVLDIKNAELLRTKKENENFY
jgi:hypothetical protein